ncbi:small, acid-soluble spore protein, alpha/beta type [Heliobacterium undosum]|uniref:Small, acid-soluble spore protein, alpha/beta type n=1 Tax=Heliomicrobium undosum TaxID=121734 RepID=A0A845KYL1_9FIRM|nr:alpha/beta-type small acid-soluble spore protein [Heliomicrobium undosum]MZP29012.1 small, acid-soluble spore protein, alpha/beta type [Heliomicrobium undosum]
MPNRNKAVFPGAQGALDRFKYEVAAEIGLANKVQSAGWENMTTREVGSIGGFMTKKMVQLAEQQLAQSNGVSATLARSAGSDAQQGALQDSGR